VFFVTRLKDNATFTVEAEVSAPKGNILADELINLPGSVKSSKALRLLRRVVVWDELNGREIVLLTDKHLPSRSKLENVLVWIQNQLPNINRTVDALSLSLTP
jgi:hypothetical protein